MTVDPSAYWFFYAIGLMSSVYSILCLVSIFVQFNRVEVKHGLATVRIHHWRVWPAVVVCVLFWSWMLWG